MGFDVGKLIGNLLLSFFSQRGHERAPGERDAYRALDPRPAVVQVWSGSRGRFVGALGRTRRATPTRHTVRGARTGVPRCGARQGALMRRLLSTAWASPALP